MTIYDILDCTNCELSGAICCDRASYRTDCPYVSTDIVDESMLENLTEE